MKKKSSYKPVEVNKWNKKQWSYPAFMPDEYKEENQYGFGGSFLKGIGLSNLKSEFTWDGLGKALGQGVGKILGTTPDKEETIEAEETESETEEQ